ncbi:hypothetical protein [Paenibacillus nasutitermitis]|uniref:Uncharacterized protein n=1 Tax=Paenibacillus nasutitermitis TaxID=1652958 RepID=A0A916YQJ9_9BACL|nr:hypothetical protein [Paenibacillus nasutitermitis]GGD57034.1 hypothetical protein GCM10010911_13500 [Paenibacillus nasutitermitis]
MIVIGILYGYILWQDIRYLRQKKRKPRTFFLVIASVVILFIVMETLFFLRDRWTFGQTLEFLFGPINRMLLIGE